MGRIKGKLSKKKSRCSKGRSRKHTKHSYKRVNSKGRKKKKTYKKKKLRGGSASHGQARVVDLSPLNDDERKALKKLMKRGLNDYCVGKKYRTSTRRNSESCNGGTSRMICKWDPRLRMCVADILKIKSLIDRAKHNNDYIIKDSRFGILKSNVLFDSLEYPDDATSRVVSAMRASAPPSSEEGIAMAEPVGPVVMAESAMAEPAGPVVMAQSASARREHPPRSTSDEDLERAAEDLVRRDRRRELERNASARERVRQLLSNSTDDDDDDVFFDANESFDTADRSSSPSDDVTRELSNSSDGRPFFDTNESFDTLERQESPAFE